MSAQYPLSQMIGTIGGTNATSNSMSLNAVLNNSLIAFGFVSEIGRTVNTARFRITSITGTLANGDVVAHICPSTAAGLPDFAGTLGNVAVNPATGFITASGYSIAVTAGVQYWVVIKNVNAVPATNFPAITYFGSAVGSFTGWQSFVGGFIKLGSVDGGTTWTTANQLVAQPIRIGFSDGSYTGGGIYAVSRDTTTPIYAKRAAGNRVTVPAWFRGNLAGCIISIGKTGTPTGNLKCNLYQNYVNTGQSTSVIPTGWATTSPAIASVAFPTPIPVFPGDILDVVLRSTVDSDTVSNIFRTLEFGFDTDAASLPLLGEWGAQALYTTDDSAANALRTDGAGWTLPSGLMCPIGLLLQAGTPYNRGGNRGLNQAGGMT